MLLALGFGGSGADRLQAHETHWRPPLLPGHAQLVRPRDAHQRRLFMIMSGHPHGWPGHLIDHIIPLKRGGADAWWNMQWQTTAEAKAKDRVE